jgi:hypothetical protein
MITKCPGCNEKFTQSIKLPKFENLLQCTNCGLLYRVIPEHKFSTLSQNLYTETSWGNLNKKNTYEQLILNSHDLKLHATRMNYLATEIRRVTHNQEFKSVLSIGPGIGLFEFEWQSNKETSDEFFLLLEPSASAHRKLTELQGDKLCINGTLAELKNSEVTFDLILCLGVDYLFEDLIESLNFLNEKLSEKGHLIISRNVFLDMECYFSGKKIDSVEDLVLPNPLINAFFKEPHYRLILAEIFNLKEVDIYQETYVNGKIGNYFSYFLQKNFENSNFCGPQETYVKWKPEYHEKHSLLKS